MVPRRDDEPDPFWNRTERNYPTQRLVHELFADRVRERPGAVAVTCGEVSLSYHTLELRAASLALELQRRYEFGSGALVALVLDRSEQVLISILAVLKAGAAYVPIAPDTPDGRIELILRESGSRVVLTDERHRARLSGVVEGAGIPVDVLVAKSVSDMGSAADASRQLVAVPQDSDSLAYVIYTSGTTGRPKGVMVEHRSVVNYICNVEDRLGLSADDICSYSTNLSFDLTVTTTLVCLALGGCVAVYPEEAHDVGAYRRFLSREGVTFIKLTPSYFGLVADSIHETNVRTVVLGGEKLSRAVLERIRVRADQELTVHDEYGPTEATVGTCHAIVYPLPEGATPNIGRLYANYRGYVLDANLLPVGVGEVGELYIGGLGVARGYLEQSELTAERFLTDPFAPASEMGTARVYRTGDLVRWLSNGELEYLGRNDDQVKIRGFRVELGEVQRAVESYGDVEQAVVVARTVVGWEDEIRGLVAYVVAGEFGCSADALAEHLSDTLPDYLRPATYVFLEELPLTPNGKVDRAALPEPEQAPAEQYVAPRTDLEHTVAQIWAEMLGRDGRPIGITDDFFRLGGDSIVAIQLLGKLRQGLGVHIPVHELLSRPTIERFCELLAERLAEDPLPASDCGGKAEPAVGEVPLLPIQEWFLSGAYARPNHWNQAFLIATPRLDVDRLRESVRQLGYRHGAFRLRFRLDPDGDVVQYYADDFSPTRLAVATFADLDEAQDQFTAWQGDFDLEHGPVFRIGYVDGLSDGTARVFVACHHLIVDAVSWRVIAEDLEAVYTGHSLPPVGSTYGQWTTAAQQYASRHPEERGYWQQVQTGYEETRAAPLHRLVQSEDTRTVSRLTLDRATTKRLLHCHHAFRTQINDVLLAAFAHALTDLTGEKVNHVILEGHGREEVAPGLDVGRTVGWFTTMFPVRLQTGVDRLTTLRDTKETLREIPAKGIGYGTFYGYHDDLLPRINFNYLGRLDLDQAGDGGRWQLTQEPSGQPEHPANRDTVIMRINAWITDGRFALTVSNKLGQEAGNHLVERYQQRLVELIDELSRASRTYLTPADVDYVVSAPHLDELQSEREVEGVYRANSLQQGFIYQAVTHGRDDDAYTVQMTWEYAAAIDGDCLRQAWGLAQRVFPALRLRFDWKEEALQIIGANATVDWRPVDLSDRPADEAEAAIRRLRQSDRDERYRLDTGPLFRVYLIKRGPERYSCIFSHHHSILDGWSNTVLVNRVHEFYEALVAGSPIDTTPDRSYLSGQKYLQEHRHDHQAFWREQVARYDERMDLEGLLRPDARTAGLRVGTARRVREMREMSFTVSGEQLADLRSVTQHSAVTVNALMLYVWHKTLASYAGAKQTIMGVVLSGRGVPVNDIETSVGLFINSLPHIVDHGTGDEPVIDGVRAVQRRINEFNAHSTVNLTELHEGADRLFDTLFIYENWPKISTDGWRSRLAVGMGADYEKLDYPLSVIVSEAPGSIQFRLVYAAELLDARYMTDMLEMQRHLLDEVLADGERPWSDVGLLSAARHRELDARLNPPAELLPSPRTLVEAFEEQVRRHPGHDAVTFEGTTLSYGMLDEQANRLARVLTDVHDVRPGELVVLCVDKGLELIVSILAVLKARAAYVLTDPTYPDSRISYILQDTAVRTVITTDRYVDRLGALGDPDHAPTVLALDSPEVREALAAADLTAPGVYASLDDLMYVLYTSGTTGVPKGVMIEHQAYARTIAGVWERYFAGRATVSTYSLTNHVFDIFGLEYGLPLWTGGSVELAADLPSSLDCAGLDFVQLTPSVCDVMLDRLVGVPADLLLLVGGERLSKELLERALARSLDVVNVYGPTETTIWSTSRLYRCAERLDGMPVSIGTPFSGESVHVLDEALRPLPMGAVGELCIGGDGLARGYLNKDELTAERFVHVARGPDGGTSALRLYRTGDLVRLLPSGVLEFIGRNDSQVKIDGHRIELGEVDAALAGHPAVRQSVVLVLELGSPVLVGYYVADREIPQEELDEHLRRSLPGYMVPARCIHLASMPLTINGKVDRAALPRPSGIGTRAQVPPRSRLEADLCALVARLLGLDPVDVGIDDDFFQLGGSSLLSIKLVSSVERELGVSTTVGHLLAHRTIREFVDNLAGSQVDRVIIPTATFDRPEDQRLSFAQERLWFIERFEGGTSAYNLPLVLEVADDVDTDALLSAVRAVIVRHDVLRTLLKQTPDGTGYQEVLDADVAVVIETARVPDQEAMHAKIRRDLQRVFDLASEVPVRVGLYEVAGVGRRLVFVIHHVAFDGWSIDVLMEDLLTAYDVAVHGAREGAQPLDAPQLRYRDFAVWQRDHLTGERLERLERFWEAKLKDYQNLDLVPDRPRPDSLDYRGADIRLAVGEETSRRLRRLAEELRVSLFSLLLSAHFLTLRCFSNQDDVIVGTPVANRDHPQLARLVGFFVNTLPLRSRIDGEATIARYVRETAREVLDMLRHQELPLEQLLEVLEIDRDVSRHPIFQVTFGVQSFGSPARGNDDRSVAVLRPAPETQHLYTAARFDLSAFVDDSLEALELHLNYATGLFERATVDSFAQTYLTILRQFADLAGSEARQRQATVGDLVYVDGERYRELMDWSAPRERHESRVLLHRSVEEHARRTPDRIALVSQDRRLSYQELNADANRLAHHLQGDGTVGPGDLVLLCLDRGADIVISILAALKAGGGYLPADPTYPDDRIRFMIADGGVRTILTHRRYLGRFAAILSDGDADGEVSQLLDVDVIAVDDPSKCELLRGLPETEPVTAVAPPDVAYVLYTSGTTGRPKGVPQTHANVARLFTALEGVYDLREDDVWTLFHNYVFDFTVWEMWGAFLYGGRLVVPTFEETRDPELYYALCRREGVTMLCQTPTAFYQFVDVALAKDEQDRADDLRYVFFGGEPLNVSLLEGWFARYSHRRPLLAMGYGTTETTVFTCYKIYDESDEGSTDIGSLIPDVGGYVLDSRQRPLPMGAVGELHIGGAGLAAGFLNRPELAATKFVDNPFVGDGGAPVRGCEAEGWNTRLYKSGDLVRWAPDRTLRFVGRNDLQVKIRGHRIELGEIEAVLSGVPGVRQCAVIVHTTGGAEKQLVGYYVAEPGVDCEALFAGLREKLPTYMVPAALVPVADLPRRITGKLDVDALPAPQLRPAPELVAPRNAREALVRRVLAEVLVADPEAIGVHNDFFQLGGNSILSIKLASRLSAELGTDVSIASVFRYRSVAGLVGGLGTAPSEAVSIPRIEVRTETEQVASFAQERFWFIDQYESGNFGYNITLCFEVLPGVDVDALERCLREVRRRHEVLRTVVRQVSDGRLYQVVLDTATTPLDVGHVTVTGEADLAARFGAEGRRKFDLTREAPLRVAFYRQAPAEGSPSRTFLGIVLHHIAFDGWSADILLDELSRLYWGAELPEPHLQYKDYAAWERQHVSGARLAELVGYWKGRLQDRRPLELPTDRVRPANIDYRGSRLSFELDPQASTAARRLAHESGVGIFSVLLSAFFLTLRAYTGRSDMLVGIPVANRTYAQTHELIGCLTNTLALDFDIEGDDDVETLIKKVAARVVEAQEHQELPFERLVAELQLPTDPSRHPLFQIWFDVNSFAETDAARLVADEPSPAALLRTHTVEGESSDDESAIGANLDFGLVVNDAGESLTGTITYAKSLFDDGTVERFASTYRSILIQFARTK